MPVADAFVTAGIVKSKGDARRAIKDGGAYVNGQMLQVNGGAET